MDDYTRRRLNMLIRVRDFGVENAADFPAGSAGATNFAAVGTAIDDVEASGADQSSGFSSGRQSTAQKAAAREELRDAMEAISVTARALSFDIIGLEDKFRMPRGNNDQNLLNAARMFATDAVEYQAQFIEYGLPATFIADLTADINAFDATVTEQNEALDEQVEATAAIDTAIENGMKAVKRLEAIVTNAYRNKPAQLAAWTSASHVERPPKKSKPSP